MKKEDLELFKGRKIKIILKNGYFYTGSILFLGDDFFRLSDKFGLTVQISYSEIGSCMEVA